MLKEVLNLIINGLPSKHRKLMTLYVDSLIKF